LPHPRWTSCSTDICYHTLIATMRRTTVVPFWWHMLANLLNSHGTLTSIIMP
jgi:hypothetical protein